MEKLNVPTKTKNRRELSEEAMRRAPRYSHKYRCSSGDGAAQVLADLRTHLPSSLSSGLHRSYHTRHTTLPASSYSRGRYSDSYMDSGSSFGTSHGTLPSSSYSRGRYSDSYVACGSNGVEDLLVEDTPGVVRLVESSPRRTEWSQHSEEVSVDKETLDSRVEGQLAIEGPKRQADVPIPIHRVSNLQQDQASDTGRVIPIVVVKAQSSDQANGHSDATDSGGAQGHKVIGQHGGSRPRVTTDTWGSAAKGRSSSSSSGECCFRSSFSYYIKCISRKENIFSAIRL